MGRAIVSFLFALVLVGVLVTIGGGIYSAGVAQGVIDAGRFPIGTNVPVAGYGWHGGPGIFGLLFGIFFLFLLFGLLRAAFSRGRGWGHGYGPGGGWGPGCGRGFEGGPEAWREERERRMADLHRKLHEADSGGGSDPDRGSTGAR